MRTTNKDSIAREGLIILGISFLCTVILARFHFMLAVLGTAWFVFCLYFFRNPKRVVPTEANVFIAPADGTILSISEVDEPHFLKKNMMRVCIFMSPFNVHVNRAPESGEVLQSQHIDGQFLAAYDERASNQNERCAVHLKTQAGDEIVFVQIAGWFARRIVNYAKQGDTFNRGEIIGLIKFGSRMDIYLPKSVAVKVALKQKVKAGETIIAER